MLDLALLIAVAATPTGPQAAVDITPPGGAPQRLAFDRNDPGRVVASTNVGVVESSDRGASWSIRPLPFSLPSPHLAKVDVDAEGRLIFWRINVLVPGSSAPVIVRRENGSNVVLPLPPAVNQLAASRAVRFVRAHPLEKDTWAVLTLEEPADPFFEPTFYPLHVTRDDGATWTLVNPWASDQSPTKFEFTSDGSSERLWVETIVSPPRNDRAWCTDDLGATWVLDGQNADNPLSYDRSRIQGDVRYRAYTDLTGLGFAGVPASMERAAGAGPWLPMGTPGFYGHVACGQVDPDLVVRSRYDGGFPGIGIPRFLDVSRDGGQSWASLLALSAPESTRMLKVSPNDDAVYLTTGSFTGIPASLMRIDLGSIAWTDECSAVVNSTGLPASLTPIGTASVAENRFHLTARDLPTGLLFLPLVSQATGFTPNPGGSSGNLCLGGTIGRVLESVGMSTVYGEAGARIDLSRIPAGTTLLSVAAQETWRFQIWYRDPGSSGGSNFTSAIAVPFVP